MLLSASAFVFSFTQARVKQYLFTARQFYAKHIEVGRKNPLGELDPLQWGAVVKSLLNKDETGSEEQKMLCWLLQESKNCVAHFQPLFRTKLARPPPDDAWRFKLLLSNRCANDHQYTEALCTLLQSGVFDGLGTWARDRPPDTRDARSVRHWLSLQRYPGY
jgi:hypothetical protein